MSITAETLRQLAQFDTPTITNVIELFEVRPHSTGYMDGRIRAGFPELPPMVGLASTATFRSAAPAGGGDVYASLSEQVKGFAELPGPPVMVFQDLDDPPAGATFGEVMCSVYKAYGAVGLITSGAGRDLVQVAALRWPVFTGSTICSHGYSHWMDLGGTIRVGGLVVAQGDLLHGDANGVAKIPLEIADELPQVAAEFVAGERIVIDYAMGPGQKTLAGLSEAERGLAEVKAMLRARVSRRQTSP